MSSKYRQHARIISVLSGSALVAAAAAFPAVAATGDVEVVNTETVSVYTDASGEVTSKRIYEQIALTGDGAVDLDNPIATDGLRNLDGFGGFEVEDGVQQVNLEVDGEENLRTVSDYDGDLPLDISIAYELDGESVNPEDLVGESGQLEVSYKVENVTSQLQTLTFDDGSGGSIEKEVEVIMPMVGSLSTTLPSSFRNVASPQANIAGDGKGGTKLSFTMTLLAPIGSDTAEFGYTAEVSDAVVPDAAVSALPVDPLESPSFAAAGKSYAGGAATGQELANGAATIDGNLLKLRDGAADLLAGLLKLRNGADELSTGLQDVAAPGSMQLADGANDLRDGLGRIDDGAGKLADGSVKLADGSRDAATGGRKLADGSQRLAKGTRDLKKGVNTVDGFLSTLADGQAGLLGGLQQLRAGVDTLPATVTGQLTTNPDYQRLLGTLDSVVAGIGTPDSTSQATILGGLNLLKFGLRSPLGVGGCDTEGAGSAADDCGAADGAQIISQRLAGGVTTINQGLLPAAVGVYDYLSATAGCAPRNGAALPPVGNLGLAQSNPCHLATVAAYGYGAPKGSPGSFAGGGFAAQAQDASDALQRMYQGLDSKAVPGIEALKRALFNAQCNPAQTDPTAADRCGVSQALTLVRQGVPTLVDQLLAQVRGSLLTSIGTGAKGCDPTETLLCAATQLSTGGGDLSEGFGELVDGASKLRGGSTELAAGAGELSSGLGRISGGAGDLADGAGQLKDGTGDASDGSGRLADGAGRLADGLGAAADGSGLLADGLGQAAEGAPQLVTGAGRLSEEGTSKLVEAGEATAQEYGEMYAMLEAGAERAQEDKMVVGAPDDAIGLAAYSFEIKGEDGEGGRNTARGLAGLAVLAAGAGVFALRRRFI